jgi:hypothetical protein
MSSIKKPLAASAKPRDGKHSRRCAVCGKQKRMFFHERMCLPCRMLPADERKAKRAAKAPKRRRSIYALPGGLPSLGKHHR